MHGYLIVKVFIDNVAQIAENADVEVTGNGVKIVVKTDNFGKTEKISLDAPDVKYSLIPQHEVRPFSTYDIKVSKPGLVTTIVEEVEVFPGVTSFQNVYLKSSEEAEEPTPPDYIIIDSPVLWGDYPPKIPEDDLIPINRDRAMPFVAIPEYVIVHDGYPTNNAASRYIVSFPDYIKNVTCSEIYSTWPRETIKANVHAIVSFALNRVFTEWYLSRGYSFTITSTPTYDQKFTKGRTIFDTISEVVDEVFQYYITVGNNIHPLLAQYYDGLSEPRPGWLSQWGSKELGDRGYNALAILKHFYGSNINLNIADTIFGLPTSFPGFNLSFGMCGEEIQKMQNRLNYIKGSYSGLPLVTPANGIFNESTLIAVKKFQEVFDLPVTGIVNFATWYKITYMYVATSKMLQGIYLPFEDLSDNDIVF